jgi:nicotinamide-nucleotide amidase
MMNVAEKLVEILKASSLVCSVAESCTGGGVGSSITSVAGSSEVFSGGIISYSNEVKRDVLSVKEETLLKYGAVSRQTAEEMAEGVRKLLKSDLSVSITGIAGPGGGSEEKPVGLVWIGVSSEKGTETFKMVFRNDRKRNIERFASSALNKLREKLVNELKY